MLKYTVEAIGNSVEGIVARLIEVVIGIEHYFALKIGCLPGTRIAIVEEEVIDKLVVPSEPVVVVIKTAEEAYLQVILMEVTAQK